MGFELEFVLLETGGGSGAAGTGTCTAASNANGLYGTSLRPVDWGLYCQSSKLDRQAAGGWVVWCGAGSGCQVWEGVTQMQLRHLV